jgi:hypothetical protein
MPHSQNPVRGLEHISYRGELLSTFIHAPVCDLIESVLLLASDMRGVYAKVDATIFCIQGKS